MDKRQLKAFEKKLTERKRALEATVHRSLRDGRALEGREAEIGDIASTSFEKEIAFGQNANVSQHLRFSEQALNRINDGTFGYCTVCDKAIAAKRLGAVPWTPYCLGCQEQVERGHS